VEQAPGLASSDEISKAELRLAARNHGMPLEALRYDVTPVGLHYLLIHYDIPAVDVAEYRLTVTGAVEQQLSLSLEDLRARPATTLAVTMECAGNGRALLAPRPISQPWMVEAVGTGEWTGTPLRGLLEEAGVDPAAVDIVFAGLDRGVEGEVEQQYERALPLADALRDDVLLAYALNGAPLPPQHGYPLRLVVPGWYGMTNVKWLARIEALRDPFAGYQNAQGYRMRQTLDEPGEPVTRMLPRSLLVPPGIPDFGSRERFVPLGPCELRGRAWSGYGPIEHVEVSSDGGLSFADARLEPPVSGAAWHGFAFDWEPPGPGRYELCSRATDAAGNGQPLEPRWNLGGYANNAVERVPVSVS
jgi:DMSO/TMAO reductase YedYZ molybdopterin-dependent catalytic subunit